MDKFKMMKKEDKSFIIENNLFDKIGKPLNINGEIYYPVLYRNLFMRYYITFTGYLFDFMNNEIKKFNIGDKILLSSTDDDSRKIYEINELIWRTFYRFPEGCNYPLNKKSKISCSQHHDNESGLFYTINGVEFRKTCFPEDTLYHNAFVIEDMNRMVASENGAVFDLRKKRFLMIHLDNDGIPFIISKKGIRINLEKVIAYSWENDNINNLFVQKIDNLSPVKAFVDRYNIAIHCKGELSYRHSQLICQNISPFNSIQNLPESFIDEKKGGSKWLYDDLGPKCQIPIEGLSDYTITKCGIIFSQKNTIIKPYKIIYKKKFIVDTLYKFPNINAIFSIKDILLWTYYRLNYSAILNCYTKMILHENLNIPIVIHCDIVSKFPRVDSESATIGEMVFTKLKDYPNYYISTTGAIYNSKHKYFIRISNIDNEGSLSINIPLGNSCVWINATKSMYSSWYGTVPRYTTITTKNRLRGDFRLSNLQISFSSSSQSSLSINKVKSIYNKISIIRDNEKKFLKKLNLIDEIFPIPEILLH